MKVRKYGCDGGCIVIGNGSCRFHVPNSYGDGEHRVIVGTDDEMRMTKYKGKRDMFQLDWEWIGVVEGDVMNVYGYDCLHGDGDADREVLFTLHGKYSIYRHRDNGDILLEGGAR